MEKRRQDGLRPLTKEEFVNRWENIPTHRVREWGKPEKKSTIRVIRW